MVAAVSRCEHWLHSTVGQVAALLGGDSAALSRWYQWPCWPGGNSCCTYCGYSGGALTVVARVALSRWQPADSHGGNSGPTFICGQWIPIWLRGCTRTVLPCLSEAANGLSWLLSQGANGPCPSQTRASNVSKPLQRRAPSSWRGELAVRNCGGSGFENLPSRHLCVWFTEPSVHCCTWFTEPVHQHCTLRFVHRIRNTVTAPLRLVNRTRYRRTGRSVNLHSGY